MRRAILVLPIAYFILCIPALAEVQEADPGYEAIQGTWEIDAVYVNGKRAHWPIQYTFMGDKVSVQHQKGPVREGRVVLNSKITPRQVDFVYQVPEAGTLRWKCVYALEAQRRLIICFPTDGGDRPTTVFRHAQEGVNVVILKQ